ncbi:hypothetical protein [Streptomyces sp. NPDC006879]|uniref:bestrophin-like domain n=1 Tax=Streptomyces sp. NPDC006879 TaxID=3364767 RepID=UPI0036A762FF
MSKWLVLLIAMASTCAVVLAIAFLNQRRVRADDDPSETPDVIEYMTMMIGVIYAIVLGLAIAGAWETRGSAQAYVAQEAQALHEVSVRSEVYPPAVRTRVQADLDAYLHHVVTDEWHAMADRGEVTERGGELLERLRRTVRDYEPRTELEGQAYQPLVDQVALVDEARMGRADSAGSGMPGVVWFGLLVGAAITVGLIFTLQIRRSFREMLLAGLFSALIAFLLFLIWDFDSPFSEEIGDMAAPFFQHFPQLRD